MNLYADVVDASILVFHEEVLNGALVSKRVQQFELGVPEVHKHHSDSMLRELLQRDTEEEEEEEEEGEGFSKGG